MGAFSFCLARLRRRMPAGRDAVASNGGEPCDAVQSDPPLSFSELVAASSILDFGGLLDELLLSRRDAETDRARRRWK